MEGNPNQDRIRRRIEQEQADEALIRQRKAAAQALEGERVLLEIPMVCQQIVAELNRLDWPGATLQDSLVLYALDHQSAVAMDGEIYMKEYQGDGEYSQRWHRFTRLETLAPPSFFLSILESRLNELRSQ